MSNPLSHGPCRACGHELTHTFVDLGLSPLCETFPKLEDLDKGEHFYPLHVFVCDKCFLVQLKEYVKAEEIFDEYAYFSSFSTSWLEHATRFCNTATERLGLSPQSFVVEVASNDGYLLKNFVEAGVPCLGIEPSWNVAEAAREKGVDTLGAFFGVETATQVAADRGQADLICGNNVLAHVPDINDFVGGLAALIKPAGAISLEFPTSSA